MKEPVRRRGGRTLPDEILIIVHTACDDRDFELAFTLLRLVEAMVRRHPIHKQRQIEALVAAHERLWELRHPP